MEVRGGGCRGTTGGGEGSERPWREAAGGFARGVELKCFSVVGNAEGEDSTDTWRHIRDPGIYMRI